MRHELTNHIGNRQKESPVFRLERMSISLCIRRKFPSRFNLYATNQNERLVSEH